MSLNYSRIVDTIINNRNIPKTSNLKMVEGEPVRKVTD